MAATERLKLRAKYRTVGPKKVVQKYTHCYMDKETNSLQQEEREREVDMFMVYFPQGHSIRVDKENLVRLGYHIKPRLVDMNTGDVVDMGGDLYEFGDTSADDSEDHETDDEGVIISRGSRNKGK